MRWLDRLLGRSVADSAHKPDEAELERERRHREALERVETAVRRTAVAVAHARRSVR